MSLVTKNFEDIFTFSRASTADYTDSNGQTQTAAVDVPRFTHDSFGNPLGILLETNGAGSPDIISIDSLFGWHEATKGTWVVDVNSGNEGDVVLEDGDVKVTLQKTGAQKLEVAYDSSGFTVRFDGVIVSAAPITTTGPDIKIATSFNGVVKDMRYFPKSLFPVVEAPVLLFANGDQGVWYDPSDIGTLYQDAAGTTPVTVDGDPVGRMEDKSGNANHALQATSASRPLYRTDGTLHWLEFDGVDDYLEAGTTATWNYLHDGTGGTAYGAFSGASTANPDASFALFSTGFGSTRRGFTLHWESREESISVNKNSIRATISNGTATVASFDSSADLMAGTAVAVVGALIDTSSLRVRKDASELNSASVGTVSTSNSEDSLKIGRAGGVDVLKSDGSFYGGVIRQGILSASAVTQLEIYLAAKSGVTLS